MEANDRAYLLERCLRLEARIAELEWKLKISDWAEQRQQLQAQMKAQLHEQNLKECSDCGQAKPLEAFRVDRAKPSGYRGRCKACQRRIDRKRDRKRDPDRQRAFHAAHPHKRREYQQRWKARNPQKAKEAQDKSNQRRR